MQKDTILATRSVDDVPTGFEEIEHLRDARQPDGLEEVERRVAALCREHRPLRAVLARIARALVDSRGWERIGYARLSDYAVERLGLSGRSLQSLAQVGGALLRRPQLEEALVSGRLGWTQVRLLAGLPPEEDVERWIALAERLTADRLAKRVRAVDRHSVEGGSGGAAYRGGLLELRCSREVRSKWGVLRVAASRASGRRLGIAEAAEMAAAEVLSALPAHADGDAGEEEAASALPEVLSEPAWSPPRVGADLVPELREMVDGLDTEDAFGVDERLRRALSRERRLEARIAPLLVLAWQPGLHRALGFTTREAWIRERLAMDPTRARALVRLERACADKPPLAHAWRSGALSWVKAEALVPVASSDPQVRFVAEWVAWAGRVTVRRLRDDVERAVLVADTDPEAFRIDGGLPPEARRGATSEAGAVDREIGANHRAPGGEVSRPEAAGGRAARGEEREIRAVHRDSERETGLSHVSGLAGRAHAGLGGRPRSDETCWVRFGAAPEIVRLFRVALCTVRRRIEAETGCLPTGGDALGVMLDHVFAEWGLEAKVPARHRVLARDGWRCAAPGCSSMQNLHDHHVRFRSAGGSDALENRVTLCAFHHLRGVHAGRLRCEGRAPDGLTWGFGVRPGAPPLLSYRSGDIRVT